MAERIASAAPRITVHGVAGESLSASARAAAESARLLVAGTRLLDQVAPNGPARLPLTGDIEAVLHGVASEPGSVCVLASGDPGFFGIVRALTERFGPDAIEVHPAPSSVSLAFARLGLPWDDATVVSAHGRPLGDAARLAAKVNKVAVLTSPDSPPEALGQALVGLGLQPRRIVVCSRLGTSSELVEEVDLRGLSSRTWDPLSVVVLLAGDGDGVGDHAVLSWGLADDRFDHRDGMVTKAEVRAVALGKLALPPRGVLWDVGTGSGSVAIECARLAPTLRVIAIERDPDDAARARANAAGHGVTVDVVTGTAPAALAPLPDPDRAFVGGGGIAVLDAVIARLGPKGRLVATYSALDRAAAAFERLGHLIELSVSRGRALPDGGVRLASENPVFVTWGPAE